MSASLLSGIRVAVVATAGLWLFASHSGPAMPVALSGITLLAILFAYDSGESKSVAESVAFACTGGLAGMLMLMPIMGLVPVIDERVPAVAEVWIVMGLIVFLIDRLRAPAAPAPTSYSMRAEPPAARPEFAAPRLVRDEPAPPSTVITPSVPQSEPVSEAPPPSPPPPPAPTAVPLKAGKPVEIYVNLMGEGMTMLRTVRAEHLGRDFYLIVDEMPANERWEFVPGQVVRCQKRSLSHGKGLVAIAEAPRAQV